MKKLPAPMTVADLARLVGGEAVGDSARVVEAVAEVQGAGPKDVASLHNMKYAGAAAVSNAGCLLVPPAAKDAPAKTPSRVVCPDPQAAFAKLLALIDGVKRADRKPGVSPLASVHPGARLGAGVRVEEFAVIRDGARVGDNTVIMAQCYVAENAAIGKDGLLYPQVVVREDCVLGDRVIVHSGTVIGSDGFGYTTDRRTGKHAKTPQIGNVVIKDDVEIGANVTIDRAAIESTLVDSGTKIDNLVQIAHNCRIGKDCFVVSQVGLAGSTVLEDGVILGGQVGVAGHLTIAARTQVGAQSGVMSDVSAEPGKPGPILFGSPARPHREAFKLQALFGKLPELVERVKALEKKAP